MRFIIHELPYERPLLAGQLIYEQDGQPTGAMESWRLTGAVDGYRFLRVDLDARSAASGRSTLFHATLNPGGELEQLKYRFWCDGLEVSATMVSQDGLWLAGRTVNRTGYQDEAAGDAFWFPSGMGLSLLRQRRGELRAVTLKTDTTDPAKVLVLHEVDIHVEAGQTETLQAGGETVTASSLTVAWNRGWRKLWIDGDGRVLRLERDDGLTAAATRLVRYT
jgi:hypothetical protein